MNVRVGLIVYSQEARIEYNLNDTQTKDALMAKVRSLRYMGSHTNTAGGLSKMRDGVFDPTGAGRYGDRAGVSNVAVLITDGVSTTNKALTIPTAMRAKAEGVKIYVIGVTKDIDVNEISQISSNRDGENETWWRVLEFDSLSTQFARSFATQTCKDITTRRPPPLTTTPRATAPETTTTAAPPAATTFGQCRSRPPALPRAKFL